MLAGLALAAIRTVQDYSGTDTSNPDQFFKHLTDCPFSITTDPLSTSVFLFLM